MKRKVLSFLLVIVLLVGILPAEAIAATSVWDWKGYTPISTYSDLLAIKNNLSGKYYLTQDITVTGTMSPMGSDSAPFTGILDGNGYSIKNLTISNSGTAYDFGIGLFRVNEGIIRNLTLDGATLTCTSYRYSLTDVRSTYIGFLAGKNLGQIVNCTILPNCTLDATIYSDAYIGALAGRSTGLIQHCTNNAPINIYSEYNDYTVESNGGTALYGNFLYVGGIVGWANTVKNCTNNGAIVSVGIGDGNEDGTYGCFGGIVGGGYRGTIDQCRNTADLYVTGTDYAIASNMYVGGIVGSYSGYSADELAPITCCESTGYIRVRGGMNYVGGIVGEADHVHLLYCHHAASIRVDTKYYYDYGYGYVYFGGIVGHLLWSNMTCCYKSSGAMSAYADTAYPRAILGASW